VIDDIAAAIKEATEKAESNNENAVNSADKAELKKLAEDIEALLDTENLTEEERAALEKLLEQVKEMISIIDKTAATIKAAKDLIDARDPETVTSEDKDELERAIDIIEGLLNGNHLTYNERNGLADAKAEAEEMLDAIETAQKATETENTGKVEEVTSENVKPEDKETLEAAKEDLEKALEDNGSNYTEEEKQAIQAQIQRIEEAIKALENVETVVDGIAQLPETVEPDDEATAEKILASKAAYEALTDHEKSLVDEAVKSKLDHLLASLSAYDIIEGDEGQWTKGSGEGLDFVANGPLSKFVGIVVDEIELDKASFETKSGSTVITLIDAYLESLTVGEHTITVVYTDGETSGTFTVLPKAAPTCNILLWIIVIVCLAVVVIVLVVIKKRRSVK
jgi:tetratricopeptide (TPR) repeat protein